MTSLHHGSIQCELAPIQYGLVALLFVPSKNSKQNAIQRSATQNDSPNPRGQTPPRPPSPLAPSPQDQLLDLTPEEVA